MKKVSAPAAPQTGKEPARTEGPPPQQQAGGSKPEAILPCQSPNRAAWKYVLLAAIFLAWLAFLIYCAVGGNN